MMMTEDECRIYMVPFPGTIKAAVRLDKEGFPSIYINDLLSPAARKRALEHELQHISRDDFYNDHSIEEVEGCQDQKSSA